MVKAGDIIKIQFNPKEGHEQAGYRPAVVVSGDDFNRLSSMTIVCPITNTASHFPLHVPLDRRTTVTGEIMCEQIRSLDIQARGYQVIGALPKDLLTKVLDIIAAELE